MASPRDSDRRIACNICRRRKTACDRLRPKCGLCAKSGFSCEYSKTERQPGLRAGYVAQLERRIVSLERRVSQVEGQAAGGTEHWGPRSPPGGEYGSVDGREVYDSLGPDGPIADGGIVDHDARDGRRGSAIDVNAASYSIADPNTAHVYPNGNDSTIAAPSASTILTFPVIAELCSVWFRKYHRWFPILHQPTWSLLTQSKESLQAASHHSLVVKAIVAITLPHHQDRTLSEAHRKDLQDELCASIVLEALGTPALDAVQALLILSILHYGDGRCLESANLLAVCRRIGERIGIKGSVQEQAATGPTSPSALRILPQFVNTVVAQEEKIRAYWMVEMLDSISSVGSRTTSSLTNTVEQPLLPCSDSFWAYPEALMGEGAGLRPYHYCSAFSLNVILATNELLRVHAFQASSALRMDVFEDRDIWQSQAQRIDERLTIWREEFVAAVYRLINAEYPHDDRPEMDPFIVLTNVVLNAAVITLLQRRAPCPQGIDAGVEPWAFASNRCVYACENTAFKVRQMEESELLVCHPHLIFATFVAARFCLVHSKALDANVPTNLHSLAFALHTCGKRWPLARMFEKTIRIAVAEYRTPISVSTVPSEFYDLRLSTFEICDVLVEWAGSPACAVPVQGAEGLFAIDS